MFNAICGALAEPFIGELLDLGWHGRLHQVVRIFSIPDYHMALLTLPLCMVAALVLLGFVKETRCRQQGKTQI